MAHALDADDPFLMNRWAIRLEEPRAILEPATELESDEPSTLPFLLELPGEEFQPRLSRFDEVA